MSIPSMKPSCDSTLTSTAPAGMSCASVVASSMIVFVVVAVVVIELRVVAVELVCV